MNELAIHSLFTDAAYEFPDSAQKWMPEWFTKHKGFEQVKGNRIFKIFSIFGLNDFRESFEDPSSLEDFKDALISHISNVVRAAGNVETPAGNQLEQVAYKLLRELMNPSVWAGGKHRITTQLASEDKKLRIDPGTSVIKAYNTIRVHAGNVGIAIPGVEGMQEFRDYSKRGGFTVVFSSKPEDIAAMSSRSDWENCQTLDVTQGLNACVVGSTLSKFVGVAYITKGEAYAERGEKMLARCLIRFVVDRKNNKPALIIDKMYPGYNTQFVQAITAALQKRTQVPVHDINKYNMDTGVEPSEEDVMRFETPREKIPGVMEHERTYRDIPGVFRNPAKK